MASSTVNLKALGLNFSPNQLELPPGSLVEANNVIIRRDDVIESRRGYKQFGEPTPTSEPIKQLALYRQRILRHYADKLAFQDGTLNDGTAKFTEFDGSFNEVEAGLRIKWLQSKNGNFYFTTDEGIKKISAATASEFSTDAKYITQAGGIKALDLDAKINTVFGDQTSFLTENSTVAYKLVWGKIDANNVELLGTPSERVVVYNPLKDLLKTDFLRLLSVLDTFSASTSLITDGDYVSSLSVDSDTNAIVLREKLISLAEKIDKDMVFADSIGGSDYYKPLQLSSITASSGIITVQTPSAVNTFTASGSTFTITTATPEPLQKGDLVRFTNTGGTLPTGLTVGVDYFIISYVSGPPDTFTVSAEYGGSAISVSGGSGTHTVTRTNTVKYFEDGKKINLVDFKSNGIEIDSLNGNQTISSVTASTLSFTARDYSASNSIGISGGISSFTGTISKVFTTSASSSVINSLAHGFSENDVVQLTTTGVLPATTTGSNFAAGIDYYVVNITPDTFGLATSASGTALVTKNAGAGGLGTGVHTATLKTSFSGITITTSTAHGLKDNQIIKLSNTGTVLDANWVITTKGPSAFQLNSAVSGPVAAGAIGTWDIVVDSPGSTTIIENNEYRSIETPIEVISNNDTGIVETRGTGEQLFSQQAYLSSIISKLKTENNEIISQTQSIISGLSGFNLTKRASVSLEFTVPHNIDETYFYKLYRTETTQVNALYVTPLEDTLPPIDYKLALQEYYNPALKTGDNTLNIIDTVPVEFLNKEYLYTNYNTSTAEEARPNDYPPFAKDINTFKGYTFYANTKLKQLKDLELLGVTELKNELDAGRTPKLFIFDGTTENYCVVDFVRGVQQITSIVIPSGIPIPSAVLPNTNYFDINSANNKTQYRFWFDLATDTPPLDGGKTLVRIYVPTSKNTQDGIGALISSALNQFINDFNCTYDDTSNTVTITYQEDGSSNLIAFGAALGPSGTGFSPSISTVGVGESVSGKQAVISSNDLLLPASATKLATKSFIRILNRNTAYQVDDPSVGFDTYAYYSDKEQPGLFLLEGTRFIDSTFYLETNNDAVGGSFSPNIGPDYSITSGLISYLSGVTTFDFGAAHSYLTGDTVVIANTNSTPNIDGIYLITATTTNTIQVSSAIPSTGGTAFCVQRAIDAEHSDNYKKKNRLYYSKYEQPEAVPVNVATGNFYDIGSEEKAILRVFPLRDSLFIFKEDGLYRLSSEVEPFIVSLFDSNCNLLAPDSVDALQNYIYCWSNNGISAVSESGVATASRPIDTEILRIQSSSYTNFPTATFGVGYSSDNSYIVWTVAKTSDTYATQAFRYSSLTNTWTKYTKTNNCALLNFTDDKLYLGVPTEAFMEQERKTFNRFDYADYEHDFTLIESNYFGDSIKVSSVSNLSVGDVVVQEQKLTVYTFNSLLKKLDSDPGVTDTDYYSSLKASGGSDLRQKLIELTNKLDLDGNLTGDYYSTISSKSGINTSISLSDPSVISTSPISHNLFDNRVVVISGASTSPDINGLYPITYVNSVQFSIPFKLDTFTSGGNFITDDYNFNDIVACYNKIIFKLNNDPGAVYNNYLQSLDTSTLEAVIVGIDKTFNIIYLDKTLDYVVGDITIYNAIDCSVVYSPNTFGDPLSFKHIREATLMLSARAITGVSLGFSTDLFPAFTAVSFDGSGSGLFGNDPFGENFFGGVSNSAPFRTIVPKNHQRCRYILLNFKHKTAREQYAVYGITLTGRTFSTRAYR